MRFRRLISGSLGVPKIKISAVDLSSVRSGSVQIPCNQRSLIGQRPVKYLSLRTTLGSLKAVHVSTVTPAETAGTFIFIFFLDHWSFFYDRCTFHSDVTVYLFCISRECL